ncbi:MAG: hypothetical protein PHQ27_10490 [Victivallales bacterium]|nr:hypothetical protein [Victivallales bacterium]
MAAIATAVIPSLTLQQVMWELPMTTFSYLLVQNHAGDDKVQRPTKDQEVWNRVMQLAAVVGKQPERQRRAVPEKDNNTGNRSAGTGS